MRPCDERAGDSLLKVTIGGVRGTFDQAVEIVFDGPGERFASVLWAELRHLLGKVVGVLFGAFGSPFALSLGGALTPGGGGHPFELTS